ncbi:hypothetical protein KY290_001462 [Solanum tuberosum]|uniref:Retrovirus-related Pol polyprotein from transposon TNT 1-94-like beta-barrel domain-containing protein n=1 Tax=Solanum tuberosum TaxID=4113 RepID=A0ABQ7WMD9_SOLTU|nr:hypothetical protein KY290_001462 [Solanum tuberosum]
MEMRIGARNKVAYLTGEAKKPEQTDSGYAIWITENHKVKSWLIDSMSPTLMQWYIRLSTAKKIWEVVAKTFYDGSDETRLFELNQKSFTTMQNERPLSMYYNKLIAIFKEIGHRTNTQHGSVEGILHMHSMMARLRDPKLDLESTYDSVRREAQQRQTMGSAWLFPKSSTMAFHHSISVKGRTNQSSGKHTNLICSHCGESEHSKQRCYENIGYPDWWDFSKKPRKVIPNRVVATTTSGTNQPNNNGKIEPRVNMTQPGITSNNNVNVNVTALSTNNTWVIDSGASDHMTKDPSKLQSLKPSSKPFISIANGGTSPVIGEGPIVLTDALRLDSVLVVPTLDHNLLSDILTGGTLGYGVKRHNLYFL